MRHTMTISYIMLAWVSKGIMCETNRARRQSGVYAMYYTLRKGALRGPQTSSEMGPMRGSKSGAFWGRGGGGGGGGGGISLGGPISFVQGYQGGVVNTG